EDHRGAAKVAMLSRLLAGQDGKALQHVLDLVPTQPVETTASRVDLAAQTPAFLFVEPEDRSSMAALSRKGSQSRVRERQFQHILKEATGDGPGDGLRMGNVFEDVKMEFPAAGLLTQDVVKNKAVEQGQ